MVAEQESQRIGDYFRPLKNLETLKASHRDLYVVRLLELWEEKAYRLETYFLAVNIFDRILSIKLARRAPMHPADLIAYTVTSLIIAAKQEQPLSPSINRMIKLLSEEEQVTATKPAIISLEEEAIVMLQFDFNILSPYQFLERFVRISDIQENPNIMEKATEILILSTLSIKFFRKFLPSELGAASLLIAASIMKFGKKAIASSAISDDEELKLYKDIWNAKVEKLSHIEFQTLLKPLIKMKKVLLNISLKEDINYLWK